MPRRREPFSAASMRSRDPRTSRMRRIKHGAFLRGPYASSGAAMTTVCGIQCAIIRITSMNASSRRIIFRPGGRSAPGCRSPVSVALLRLPPLQFGIVALSRYRVPSLCASLGLRLPSSSTVRNCRTVTLPRAIALLLTGLPPPLLRHWRRSALPPACPPWGEYGDGT